MGVILLFCSAVEVSKLVKMCRLALIAALCVAAVSAAPAPGGLDNWFLEATIPYLPEITIKGVTVKLDGNISIALTDPDFKYDFKTTAKDVELTDKSFTLSVGHYKTVGSVAGMDISGDGSILFQLSDTTSNKVSYTSKSADSFCAVDGTVKLAFETHTASVTITGMKDATVAALITNFVKENQATLGDTVSNLINTNYGADINKYVVPMLNSICGDLPPPSA